jgi:hypothetical protein
MVVVHLKVAEVISDLVDQLALAADQIVVVSIETLHHVLTQIIQEAHADIHLAVALAFHVRAQAVMVAESAASRKCPWIFQSLSIRHSLSLR